ncbi:unnamed protein product [Ceutorhynchus assimilis]|uniref:Optineurin n=1 Tax=Ceutorhynchus assimilis TaxID=467358 RepID=A0A9N9MLH3_9CUCU|nr:unnamed protein product [Ceutorhynchus assimilis]
MTSSGQAVEFRISQEPLPVPVMDDVAEVPSLSSDGLSFVVIKSAADLDELYEDNDLSHISMLQEHKQLYQQELADLLESTHLQPSVKPASTVNENKPTKESVDSNNADQHVVNNPKDSFQSTIGSLPNGLSPLKTANNEMNQSCLPAMPQPQQIYPGLRADEHDSRAISIVSFSPNDFGSEEIQAKVTQLIDENMHLKDTIIQNNLSMKAQYDRIMAWQNDVTKVHEAHKEKFREAKRCIETLKEENATIKQENENLRYNLQVQQTEHDKTKKLLTDTSENNLKEFQLDMANKKIKELEEELKKLNSTIAENQASYNWKAMDEKLQRYENELEQAYKKLREMEKGTEEQDNLALQIDQLKLTKEKLLLAEMALEQNNKEMYSLRNQLAINQKTSENTSKIQEFAQVVAERNRLIQELDHRNSTLLTSQARIKELEEELEEANDTAKKYKHANLVARDKQEHAAINAWMTKQKLVDLEKEYQLLLQENTESAEPQYPPDFNPGEMSYLRQQLMQSQKALIESEQNRAVSDAKVRALNNEIAELGRQLQNQQTESDDQFALKAQLEVYKADFEAEQEAKEEVKREKNKIAEDLQHLHRRNQQLQEEIEILREQQQFNPTSSMRRDVTRPQATAPTREEFIYKCPKCDFGFKTLTAVENHVIRCIELEDSLP